MVSTRSPRRGSRRSATALVALVALLASAGALRSATAVDGPSEHGSQARAAGDGAVLRPGRLVYLDGHRQDIAAQGDAMEFSPDGTRIVGLDPTSNALTVYSHDGSIRPVWPVPGTLIAATWSPDGTRVAAVVGSTPGNSRLYSVDVATGGATVLFADTGALWMDMSSSIDWDPTGSRIAFAATGHDPATGQLDPREFSQLYTVPASGGTTARFRPQPPSGTYPVFRNPRWSPSGAMTAVVLGAGPEYIGIVQEGSSAAPAQLRQTGAEPGQPPTSADTGPFWSTDGTRLAYGQVSPGQDKGVPTIISATDGAVLATYPGGNGFTDWQPCPGGACATWPTPRTLSFGVSKKKVDHGARVVFFGALRSPLADSCSDNEQVELQRAKGRKKPFRTWKRLVSAANARVNVKAKVKKTARYRLVAPATPLCLGVTSAEIKVKVRPPKHR